MVQNSGEYASLGFYPEKSQAQSQNGQSQNGHTECGDSLDALRIFVPDKGNPLVPSRCTCSWKAMEAYFPIVGWIRNYSVRECLPADLISGLTVGVMAVPQSVSFAAMAGVPAAFGLYTAFVPVLAYCLMGSSRHLALGPVALVSLLLNDGLTKAIPGSDINENPNLPVDPELQDKFNRAAVQVSILVAILYLVLGILRLGFLCNMLSKPIISAFLTAGAIIISTSQVKYILGYNIPHVDRIQDLLYNLVANAHEFKWREFVMGVAWIVLLVLIKNAPRWNKKLKTIGAMGPITVAILSIALTWGGHLRSRAGIKAVGHIDAGLPPFTVSWWLPLGEYWPRLLITAGLIGVVSLLEAISIAKALAEVNGDHVNADQELLGLGISNLAGAAFCAYPSTGSFARSAVQSTSGAKTGLAGLVNAALIGVALLCLTPVFRHMPLNALAAIVITGVIGLLDFQRVLFLFKVSKMDCLVWLATFFGCLCISIDVGLAMGLSMGLVFLFVRTAFPKFSPLQRLPGSIAYRDAEIYNLQDKEASPHVAVMRIQGPLCFANAARTKERILNIKDASEGDVKHLVLDGAAMDFMDATGLEVMEAVLLKAPQGLQVVLADPSRDLLDILKRGGVLQQLGPDQLFVRVHDAVRYCEEMCNSSSGIMNGFHYNEGGHEAPLSSAAEPLLPRRSIDCV